jgi:RNA polymerase sigma-70 factor, ECF subfamily
VTALGSGASTTAGAALDDPADWVVALSVPGPEQDRAMRLLHALMVRAARTQAHRMRGLLGGAGPDVVEEIANQAADEALMALLGKLGTFEGRSRFTTWAYKFAVLQAATAVRARAWRDRDVDLDGLDAIADPSPGPAMYAEAADLGSVVRAAIETELSPHQRRIVVALVLDEVPIDVLAERLGANRNALYKTLHDARKRLRAHLRRAGYLADDDSQAGAR